MGCQAMRALDRIMAARTSPPRNYRLSDAQPFGAHPSSFRAGEPNRPLRHYLGRLRIEYSSADIPVCAAWKQLTPPW